MVSFATLSLFAAFWLTAFCRKFGNLPENLLPQNYKLEIITNLADDDLQRFFFEGKVVIRLKCVNSTDTIILNVLNLTIHQGVTLHNTILSDPHSVYVKEWYINKINETMVIKLNTLLTEGSIYDLSMRFTGYIREDLIGYYRCHYVHKKSNEKRWLAVTQFQATHARMAFPCFDEPKFKATFEISIGRTEKYSSLSNMPLLTTEPMEEREGWFWDRYQKSLPMSTYLVAYMVSDFQPTIVPKHAETNVTFRIWTREEAASETGFAAEVAPKTLVHFEYLSEIRYPLSKLDLVALPQLRAGAMENWGLITFRESRLLYNPELSAHSKQNTVARIISHELAHQWFGNLVTIKWWNDLWLNEGFATFLADYAVDYHYPEWNHLENQAMVSNMLAAFHFDTQNGSHPVSAEVRTPREIRTMFDKTTYKKGACLVWMMINILGPDTFRKGIVLFLDKYKFGNVEQDDLFEHLTIAAHEDNVIDKHLDMKTIMDPWTYQKGYPLVTVNCNYEDNSATVTQEKFAEFSNVSHNNECWWVKLIYSTHLSNFKENKTSWLHCPKDATIIENICNIDECFVFNLNSSGLYRVNYDENNWNMLVKLLNSESFEDIPVGNRIQLLDDSAELAQANKLNYDIFFRILPYLKEEHEHLPWKNALKRIQYIHTMLHGTPTFPLFQRYMRSILDPVYKKIGPLTVKPPSSYLDAADLKTLIFVSACKYLSEMCINDAKTLFNDYIGNDNTMIPEEFRPVVYCIGIREGGETEWDFLWEKYKQLRKGEDKAKILESLACTKDTSLLERYLEWTLDESSGLKKEDRSKVFFAVAKSDDGHRIAKNFFKNNILEIWESLEKDSLTLLRYLTTILEQITSPVERGQFRQLIEENSDILSETDSKKLFVPVNRNIIWQKTHYNTIKQYFLQRYKIKLQ